MFSNLIFTLLVTLIVVLASVLHNSSLHNADSQNFNNKPNNIINGREHSDVARNLTLTEDTIIDSLYKHDKNECAPCVIKVNGHMTDKSPLLTLQNERSYIQPDRNGEIVVPNGGWVDLRCGEGFGNPCGGQILKAQCVGGRNFRINDDIMKYEDINCNSLSRPTPTQTGLSCCGDGKLLTFDNKFSDGVLYTTEVCFDEINKKTPYVKHTVYPGTKHSKRGVPRPNFIQGDFFPGVNVDHCYKRKTQIQTLNRILGKDASIYITTKNYLSRGHLAAKADYVFSGQQLSTFHFLNAAPQWQSFNGGNWSRIEDGVREFANNNDTTLLCWTGTWGICTLPDVNGLKRELYMYTY